MSRRDDYYYDLDRRNRSPDRKRSRSPSDRYRRSRRSRSRSPRKDSPRKDYYSSSSRRRSRSRDRERRNRSPKVEDIVGDDINLKKLEIVMQQRREKVEKWRLEQAKKKSNTFESPLVNEEQNKEDNKKKWNLEDDSDDSVEDEQPNSEIELDDSKLILPKKKRVDDDTDLFNNKNKLTELKNGKTKNLLRSNNNKVDNSIKMEVDNNEKIDDDEDIDPLDQYMEQINSEAKKHQNNIIKKQDKILNDKKITFITGVAKKPKQDTNQIKKKGELLEQNQDALEYSSEDDTNATDDVQAMNNNLMSINKTKKLTTISKDDITYQPFEKKFYVEVNELAQMTNEEVEKLREELEGIKVKGKNCPKPIKHWSHTGVNKKIFDCLKRYRYEKPTPIQAQAIPAIMSGRDIIGIAKTGSGKTLAFLLPMFRHILAQPPLNPGDGPIAIVITPTRELATQIMLECKKFTKYIGLRVVALYGGKPISDQIGELKPGAEIVVCTPGRMIEMLAVNSGRATNLRRCTYLVLDEADRCFDAGFEPQITRIIDVTRPDRQTVVFSATFPRAMETLARRILTKPLEISVGGRSVVCKDIEQNVLVIEEEDKFVKLLEILGNYLAGDREKSAIVFVDKQENADFLLKELMDAQYSCLALHGGIDQTDRDSTIADFKAGKVSVLVATSVASRGIDVRHCIVVVNYDCPNHYEDYVHRCGRTGRAGNKGYAYTFITPDQGKYAFDINKALELSGYPINEQLVALFNNYKSRQEALGRQVKAGGSGFGGKGFQFNEQEAQLINEKRKFEKVALGLQDSDDEDPEEAINEEIEKALMPKKPKQQPINAQAQNNLPNNSLNTAQNPSTTTPNPTALSNSEKIELAKKAALKILANKTTSTAEAFLRGETNTVQMTAADDAKSLAERRAEMLNARLNYIPKDNDDDSEMQDQEQTTESGFKRFEEELEINDFPQQARWRVTSKEAIAQIAEYSEAGITVRGIFVPPGSRYNPDAGDRKLYLAIEGTSEWAVKKAKDEIIRLIREELNKLKQSNNQVVNKSRYKVI